MEMIKLILEIMEPMIALITTMVSWIFCVRVAIKEWKWKHMKKKTSLSTMMGYTYRCIASSTLFLFSGLLLRDWLGKYIFLGNSKNIINLIYVIYIVVVYSILLFGDSSKQFPFKWKREDGKNKIWTLVAYKIPIIDLGTRSLLVIFNISRIVDAILVFIFFAYYILLIIFVDDSIDNEYVKILFYDGSSLENVDSKNFIQGKEWGMLKVENDKEIYFRLKDIKCVECKK